MIEVKNLHYRYATQQALHNVSFTLDSGTITALVGQNGAGKSTLLRCMAALDSPFSGSIRLWGNDTHEEPRACHRLLGYLSDQFGLYDNLTVAQSLIYMAVAHRVPEYESEERVAQTAAQLGLSDRLNQKTGELSRGFRQRVAIAQAIIHRPRLLLLDEPASGLDPEARLELSALLKELARKGMTIMVSSHILSELQDYSTHMLKLHEGNLVTHESLGNYQPDHSRVLQISLSRPTSKVESILNAQAGVSHVSDKGNNMYQLTFKGKMTEQSALLFNLINAGLPVAEVKVEKGSLQELYLADVDFSKTSSPRNDGLKPEELAHIAAQEHPPTPIN